MYERNGNGSFSCLQVKEGVNERKCMGECIFLCINGLTEIFFWKIQTNLLDIFGVL